MGLARRHRLTGEDDLTQTGMTLGTFDYISPEQARDPRAADTRSDLYSLGCTLFFVLVGRPPFADGTLVQKLLQHQQEPPPAVEALRPDVPAPLAAIIARLMAKDPNDRYQRPAALAADLVSCAEACGIDVALPRPVVVAAPVADSRRRASLPWLVPLIGFALLVATLWIRAIADRRDTDREAAPDPPAAAPND
jgi:serine/threonine-protein kinase